MPAAAGMASSSALDENEATQCKWNARWLLVVLDEVTLDVHSVAGTEDYTVFRPRGQVTTRGRLDVPVPCPSLYPPSRRRRGCPLKAELSRPIASPEFWHAGPIHLCVSSRCLPLPMTIERAWLILTVPHSCPKLISTAKRKDPVNPCTFPWVLAALGLLR